MAGVFFAFISTTSGQEKVLMDTLKQPLIAATVPVKAKVILRSANVVFPAIFENHREQSSAYIEKYAKNKREHIVSMYRRSGRYFPKVRTIFKKYNVPAEFAALLAIESGFNPKVVSGAGAVGYWQFMDETAKEYGLKIIESKTRAEKLKEKTAKQSLGKADANLPVKEEIDERENFNKSTTAAARYFRDMYKSLGDWLLVAAAYNCGLGRVKNAMAASGKSKPGFWDIKQFLPSETRAYVMNLLALNVVFKNYKSFEKSDLIFNDIVGEEVKLVPPVAVD